MSYKLHPLDFSIPSEQVFESIKNEDWSVFLNSNNKKYTDQRFDILSASPKQKIIFSDDSAYLINKNEEPKKTELCPFELLREVMSKYKSNCDTDIPFSGGAIGYISYDYGNYLHNIENKNNHFNQPLLAFGIYDWAVIYDYALEKSFLLYHEKNSITENIINNNKKSLDSNVMPFQITSRCESNMNYDLYEMKLLKILEYIRAGDCYQVNLSQMFTLSYEGNEYELYKNLNKSFASPYSAYMNYPFGKILSFSPERFLSIKNNIVETKPIKGTRPRSDDPNIDKKNIEDLESSQKDRAENLMIVDLLRNDLGMNCKKGSVKVDKLFDIETFANVHHLVSTIHAEIDSESNIYNLIKDAFPGGSITGAPKLRAMQIIHELEPNNRSIYCGSIGYISFDEKTDFNISIRSMISKDNNLYFWGGGGIVYDSDIRSEYNETISKVKPLLDIFSD
mgnify:CR=1 FL=1|tara:strand:- start:103 stop:1455 length:1353 start_codon:yes stop_codon:yes gene_type:complete